MIGAELPERELARMWEAIDWKQAQARLDSLQERIGRAALAHDNKTVRELQEELADDLWCRCLAVRHVAAAKKAPPGVDGVRWTTDAQKMAAAISLNADDWHAQPQRQFTITAKNTGKKRHARLACCIDRAMATLHAYTLLPVAEAWADRKSFAFRPGRSAHDAAQYVASALSGEDAPRFVVVADVKGYYASIQHSWLMRHAPMNKRVLAELLGSGFVVEGELFPSGDHGLSEGSGLSPALGNLVLDGLQGAIYRALNGSMEVVDFADGNMVRYADDVVVTARSRESAQAILGAISAFCAERGLALSEDKTFVRDAAEGFTFLSRTFTAHGGRVVTFPAEAAVERFIAELRETALAWRKSQRALIEHLNRKLKGWAGYHRYSHAEDAFRRVDAALNLALVAAARKRNPRRKLDDLLGLYWFEEPDGWHSYSLPHDRSCKVHRLASTVLARHGKVRATATAYVDADYFERRERERDIVNVSGRWKAVWERTEGNCHHCGAHIRIDQPKAVVRVGDGSANGPEAYAYIHLECAFDEVENLLMDSFAVLGRYDGLAPSIAEAAMRERADAEEEPMAPQWPYAPLRRWFARQSKATVILTFKQMEGIVGREFSKTAKSRSYPWKDGNTYSTVHKAWTAEGYSSVEVDIEEQRVKFARVELGAHHLEVPAALTEKRIPDNAAFELEQFFDYIIAKYAL